MLSAKSTIHKKINPLGRFLIRFTATKTLPVLLVFTLFQSVSAQDNSPYSRYGLGDLVPSTNIVNRGMGGFSAGYIDMFSVNFNNPASYAYFQSFKEQKSKKLVVGRPVLDIGINVENRNLSEPNSTQKFKASNALFSHVQLGIPLSTNWGMSFGLRPITRVSYKMSKLERIFDPNTNLPIDSAINLNQGDGGSYLASIGTGYKFSIAKKHSLAIGFNTGYLFGKKDYSSRRAFLNDSILFYPGNYQTITNYGNIYLNAGLQYTISLKNNMSLTAGIYGNMKQTLKASQDIIRETYSYNETQGYTRTDSVAVQRNIKGNITYPSNLTYGLVLEKRGGMDKASWLVGVDYVQNNWSDYRFYDQPDPTVRDKSELRLGGQLRPIPTRSYFSNVAYRAGFFTGNDYVYVNEKLPVTGITLGLGLPIANRSRMTSPDQVTFVNLAFEFVQRGNNESLLKENLFRFSAGFSLTDFWFRKRKYE